MNWLFPISALWAIATLYLFFQATRLCYRIEKRSHPERFSPGAVPRRANWIAVAFNYKVARDAETQALRRSMNVYLIVIMAGFIAMGLLVSLWSRSASL